MFLYLTCAWNFHKYEKATVRLSNLRFLLWDYLRKIAHQKNQTTITKIYEMIRDEFENLPINTFRIITANFELRLGSVLETGDISRTCSPTFYVFFYGLQTGFTMLSIRWHFELHSKLKQNKFFFSKIYKLQEWL